MPYGNYAINRPNANGRHLGLLWASACLAFLLWFSALTVQAESNPVALCAGVVLWSEVSYYYNYSQFPSNFFISGTTAYDFSLTAIAHPLGFSGVKPWLYGDYYKGYYYWGSRFYVVYVYIWRDSRSDHQDNVYYEAISYKADMNYSHTFALSGYDRIDISVIDSSFCPRSLGHGLINGNGTYTVFDFSLQNTAIWGADWSQSNSYGNVFGKMVIVVNTYLTTFYQSLDPGTMTSPTINGEDLVVMPTATSGAGGAMVVDPTGESVDDTSLARDFDLQAGVADNTAFSGITQYLATSTSAGGGGSVSVGWDGANLNGLIPDLSFGLPTTFNLTVPSYNALTGAFGTTVFPVNLEDYRAGLAGVRVVTALFLSLFGAISTVYAIMAIFKYHPGA